MSDGDTKPRRSPADEARRRIMQLSMNDMRALLHGASVATQMLDTIRDVAAKAVEQGAAIDAAGLLKWIDDHKSQLDIATAKPVEGEGA